MKFSLAKRAGVMVASEDARDMPRDGGAAGVVTARLCVPDTVLAEVLLARFDRGLRMEEDAARPWE